jgi:hypothetical protein
MYPELSREAIHSVAAVLIESLRSRIEELTKGAN